jgi:hypothetical protein
MFYRFIPTSIAYKPAFSTRYFPSTPELLMAVGYVALGTVLFVLAVNYFAVLPGEAAEWDHTFRLIPWPRFRGKSILAVATPAVTAPITAREGGI